MSTLTSPDGARRIKRPRPTQGRGVSTKAAGLHLANPLGAGSVSPDPLGAGSVSPDLKDAVSVSPKATGSISPNPSGAGSVSPDLSGAGSVSPDPSGAAPDGSPYRHQPLRARKAQPKVKLLASCMERAHLNMTRACDMSL